MKTLPTRNARGQSTSFFHSLRANTTDFLKWCWLNRGFVAKWMFIAVIVYVVARGTIFYIGYDLALGYLWGNLGFDHIFAGPIALFLAIIVMAFGPTVLWYALYWKRKRELVVVAAILSSGMLFSAFFFARDAYFNRISGESMQCYAKTLEGFKFSSTCDFDSESGVQYQKVTPEVLEEIYFWKKHGKLGSIPPIESGKFFDPLTGKAIVWYSDRPNGAIFLSPLPGFDTTTGDQLKPITKAIVEKHGLERKSTEESSSTSSPTNVLSAIDDNNVASSITYLLDYEARVHKYLNSNAIMQIFGSEVMDDKTLERRDRAITEVWKWYFSHEIPLEQTGEKIDFAAGGKYNQTVHGFAHVERVLTVGSYILVAVVFSSDSTIDDFLGDTFITLLDRKAHHVDVLGILPETKSIREAFSGFGYSVSLSPQEKIRVLLVLQDVPLNQVSSGYLRVFDGVARY